MQYILPGYDINNVIKGKQEVCMIKLKMKFAKLFQERNKCIIYHKGINNNSPFITM